MELATYMEALRGKRIAVIGVGVSNLPLIKMLLQEKLDVTARDKRTEEQFEGQLDAFKDMGLKLRLGPDYLQELDEDVIFRTPGMRPDIPELQQARARGAEITSEMEAFFSVCPCPIIAVTGSDGKTTTTTLVSELLNEAGLCFHLGGNIGNPLLADTPSIRPTDYAVVELSSFQLMTMQVSADIAVITNVTPNHLDYHKDMAEYIRAKQNVYLHQGSDGLVVLNADNETTAAFAKEAKGKVRLFSRRMKPDNGCWFDGETIYYVQDGQQVPVVTQEEIILPGVHNIENLMAAFAAVVDIVGVENCRRVARRFKGVEHRIEPVRALGGVMYYNDSIASSPTRTIAALDSFRQKVILIAGGYDKKVPYDELGRVIAEESQAAGTYRGYGAQNPGGDGGGMCGRCLCPDPDGAGF